MPKKKKRASKKGRRTTHRSISGTKLCAIRDSKGRFKDIQTYKTAHPATGIIRRRPKGSAGTNNTGPRRR